MRTAARKTTRTRTRSTACFGRWLHAITSGGISSPTSWPAMHSAPPPHCPSTREPVHVNPQGPQVLSATRAQRHCFGRWCFPVVTGAGCHVQRKRDRVCGGNALAHDVRHLLLGERYLPRSNLDAERHG